MLSLELTVKRREDVRRMSIIEFLLYVGIGFFGGYGIGLMNGVKEEQRRTRKNAKRKGEDNL